MTERSELTPGSDRAYDQGCICPVGDNARGRGIPMNGETMFWINGACPIHGRPDAPVDEAAGTSPAELGPGMK